MAMRLALSLFAVFCCLSPHRAQQFVGEPCNLTAPAPPSILQEFETLLNLGVLGTCTPYRGTFCNGVLNPGEYVYVGPKTIALSRGNLTYLTTYLEQNLNFSGLLESTGSSPMCKQIMREALCTYYYPVCRNASGNATVLHTICPSNCDYIAQDLCPIEWATFNALPFAGHNNLRFDCRSGAPRYVQVTSPYCCIPVAIIPASTSAAPSDSMLLSPDSSSVPSLVSTPLAIPPTSLSAMATPEVKLNPSAAVSFTSSATGTTSSSLLAPPAGSMAAHTTNSEESVEGFVIGTVLAVAFIVALVLGGVCVATLHTRKKHTLRRQATLMGLLSPRPSSNSGDFQPSPNPYLLSVHQVHLTSSGGRMVKIPSNYLRHLSGKMLIPEQCLQIMDCIGQGEFGIVYRAYLREWAKYPSPHLVAVKTIKGETSDSQISQMLEESVKMKDFDHPNILSLIGVCIAIESSPYIVMPFMANGSLLSYLKQQRHNLTIANGAEQDLITETQRVLLSICLQIAKGMEYLASQKFVHRDLAARNCMIDLNNVIKVADFGLSEDMYAKNYYRQSDVEECKVKLPIRWMAPESFHDGVFSEKTDVWSYGVTCWEVFTLGKIPYPGVTPFTLIKYLDEGGRLEKPSNAACSDQIYDLMRKCWCQESEDRPPFSNLVLAICGILEPLAGYVDFRLLPANESTEFNSHDEDITPTSTPTIIIEDEAM
uniref:Protein tyrosine kinase n=1 Tax=Ephydatia fluviatilis TaxID=31330 RepID=Q9Y1Y7_9METZ|nr:protein tyrosine kinase [Ephydatia fluviatilis]